MLHARGPNLAFHALKSVFKVKIKHFMLHLHGPKRSKIRHFIPPSRGPAFFISRLKIPVFGHKLETLCFTRADPILAFCALKSVFKVKNSTLYAPLARTRFFLLRRKIHVFGHKLDTLWSTLAYTI